MSTPRHLPARLRPISVVPASFTYVIRDAGIGDLPETARLHVRDLPVGMFPRLGQRFVKRWHRSFLRSPHALALSVVHLDHRGDERIVGFLVGATDRDAFTRELLTQHSAALIVRGTLALVLRPRVLGRFLTTRLQPFLRRVRRAHRETRHGDAPATEAPRAARTADLTAIVITRGLRGTGVGTALVHEFLQRCSAAGAAMAELSTVSPQAARFYESTGWVRTGKGVTFDGQQVVRFSRATGWAEGG